MFVVALQAKIILCSTIKNNLIMKKAEMERLVEMTAQRTASIVMDQLKGIVRVPGEEEEEYVDVKEAARILGLAPSYLRSQRRKFPHKKVGSSCDRSWSICDSFACILFTMTTSSISTIIRDIDDCTRGREDIVHHRLLWLY